MQEGFKGDELKARLMYNVVMGFGTALNWNDPRRDAVT